MKTLTRKEIIEGLMKLGIKKGAELKNYIRDYEIYCSSCNVNSISTK